MIRRTRLVLGIEKRFGASIEDTLRRLLATKSPAEVVEEIGVAPSTLGYWCLKAKIPMRRGELSHGKR